MNRGLATIWAVITLAGCATEASHQTTTSPVAKANTATPDTSLSGEFKWVAYKDPIADVNLAVAKSDYNLIALVGDKTEYPGLQQQQVDSVTQTCGVKYVDANSGFVRPTQRYNHFTALTDYASKYNALMWQACLSESE